MDWNKVQAPKQQLQLCYSPHREYGLKYKEELLANWELCYSQHGG